MEERGIGQLKVFGLLEQQGKWGREGRKWYIPFWKHRRPVVENSASGFSLSRLYVCSLLSVFDLGQVTELLCASNFLLVKWV